MDSRQKVFGLVTQLQELPLFDEPVLLGFISDLKLVIEEIFGPSSPYLDYLKYIKFQPDAVFITDKERDRSWQDGIAQIDNLLRVIVHDPKISGQIILGPNRIEPLVSSAPNAAIEEAVQHSLQDFKNSVAEEYPQLEEGPMKEPLGTDVVVDGAAGHDGQQEHLPNLRLVLCVPGRDEVVNQEVTNFLERVSAKITAIPKAVGQESLMDRLSNCLNADFVVFILSADHHCYPRTQRPVDGNLIASQEAVFELGYFAAKYDRHKMVILYQEHPDFVRPTEFFELFYIPVNPSGTWKGEMLERMKGKRSISERLGLSAPQQPLV